jgi:hypothetical protein
MNRVPDASSLHRASDRYLFPRLWSFAFGALLLVASTALAAPSSDYNFVIIAEGGGPEFWAFGNAPSINSHGTVAFTTLLADVSTYALYTGEAASTTKVIDTTHPIFAGSTFRNIENNPTINDSGVVAFGAYMDQPSVWKIDGNTPTLIDQGDINVGPSINNSGAVALAVSFGPSQAGVAVGGGGPLTYIADVSDGFSAVSEPVLNDSGKAVFLGQSHDTGDTAIYVGDGGPLTTIVAKGNSINGGPPIALVGNRPTINDLDQVAFMATDMMGVSTLYMTGAGGIATVADTAGPFAEYHNAFGSRPAINNNGDIVFFAALDGGGNGAFTGPDAVNDRILGAGDVLFGRTVADVVFGPAALNDRGQFVMQILMETGPALIVRADPVPEPTTIGLLTAALGGGLTSRARSRRRGLGGGR